MPFIIALAVVVTVWVSLVPVLLEDAKGEVILCNLEPGPWAGICDGQAWSGVAEDVSINEGPPCGLMVIECDSFSVVAGGVEGQPVANGCAPQPR